ncbi:hypothetical protein D9757_012743 [Collybiopsis confluens]|uniref:GST N-terminal domain-containing protein n=1 Tax=Collybiopsis confluens TaxID=2823264 RepID=A0A8H5FU69_9AGAR|nr:hypothetical protein D9757_013618 [Collybiopsis confluens]KAF5364859.1 hypothetical protein D9757_012743 [Collybiopsis confluens]
MSASNQTEIIFYDIPLAEPEPNICWSPNTWKTRFCLNYKGLPYRTEWVEYPDIEGLCKKIGAAPTGVESDGVTPAYTLPVIYDPTTKRAISESFNIALYLDATYPGTPRLIPSGTSGLQSAFISLAMLRIIPHLVMIVTGVEIFQKLSGRSQEFFRRTREASYGMKMEEFTPKGEARVEAWKKFQKGLQLLTKHYDAAKEENGGEYLCGSNPTFADFGLAGLLHWCKAGFGADSEQWKEILELQGGRWATFVTSLDRYTKV